MNLVLQDRKVVGYGGAFTFTHFYVIEFTMTSMTPYFEAIPRCDREPGEAGWIYMECVV